MNQTSTILRLSLLEASVPEINQIFLNVQLQCPSAILPEQQKCLLPPFFEKGN